jgi:RHS repeat-associated protein
VQYWTGSQWQAVPGGGVSGNNLIWRKFTFPAVTTTKIRVLASASPDGYSRLAEVEAYTPGGEAGGGAAQGGVNWLVSDHLGTPRMVVDQTGSLAGVKRHDYLPFGEEVGAGVGGRTTGQGYVGDNLRQGFVGYEKDGETGLNYAQARYHSPTMGRFTSVDPLMGSAQPIHPQSWNRYAYCLNNPLKFIDPTGLIWGYADDKGTRSFKWFDGDKVGDGYTAYNDSSYTFANGNAAWLGHDGQWGWIDTVSAEAEPVSTSDCLYCGQLATEMQKWGPALEQSMEIMWTADNLLIGGVTSIGSVGSATLGLESSGGEAAATAISTIRQTTEGETFFHYGYAEHAEGFAEGLRPGSYATNVEGLSGVEAQSGLSLRHAVPPDSMYVVRPQPGTWIDVNPVVRPQFGQPGGLSEYYFLRGTGPGTVSGPFRIP